jgi:hypothetical protein
MKVLNDIACKLNSIDGIQLKRNGIQIDGEGIENLLVNMVL